jgi:hypothetical protein
MVGERGFEPPTPWSPNQVLYQAEPLPDDAGGNEASHPRAHFTYR